MDPALKCHKKAGQPMSELDKGVAQALLDVQLGAQDAQRVLMRELTFVSTREFDVHNKRVLVIFVPVPQLRLWRQVQHKVTRELEKKFENAFVMLVAWRRVLPKQQRGGKRIVEKQKRPRSRTLTSVHEAILQDLVFPAEIVGKRIRVQRDAKRLFKIHLDKQKQNDIEHKIDSVSAVYKKMTSKDVVFEFHEGLFAHPHTV